MNDADSATSVPGVLERDADHRGSVPVLRVGASDLFDRASALVNGARQDRYGEPVAHWSDVATVWSVLAGCEISAHTAALMMAALKLVRESKVPDVDNRTDAVGYLEIVERIADASVPAPRSSVLPAS